MLVLLLVGNHASGPEDTSFHFKIAAIFSKFLIYAGSWSYLFGLKPFFTKYFLILTMRGEKDNIKVLIEYT